SPAARRGARGEWIGRDLVDVVPARAETLDEMPQALDVRSGDDGIALGVVHSQHGRIQPPGVWTRSQWSGRSGRDDWGSGASFGSVWLRCARGLYRPNRPNWPRSRLLLMHCPVTMGCRYDKGRGKAPQPPRPLFGCDLIYRPADVVRLFEKERTLVS